MSRLAGLPIRKSSSNFMASDECHVSADIVIGDGSHGINNKIAHVTDFPR